MTALAIGLVIAFATVLLGGVATWIAYMSKQMVEHAKFMAAAAFRLEAVDKRVADLEDWQDGVRTVLTVKNDPARVSHVRQAYPI